MGRYGLIRPTRTDSGHRLYSMADVEAVRSILAWTERGVAVSKVGSILGSAATREAESRRSPLPANGANGRRSFASGAQLRRGAPGAALRAGVFHYPLAVVFQDVLLPVWQALLLRQDEFGGSSEWLFLDAFLRARALQRLQLARVPGAERVLLSALPGQCRELELLVAGLLLSGDSLAVTVLPLGQPLEELALVCDKMRPQGLVMFSNVPPNEVQLRQLNKLSLSLDCPLALAGEAADSGARPLRARRSPASAVPAS